MQPQASPSNLGRFNASSGLSGEGDGPSPDIWARLSASACTADLREFSPGRALHSRRLVSGRPRKWSAPQLLASR